MSGSHTVTRPLQSYAKYERAMRADPAGPSWCFALVDYGQKPRNSCRLECSEFQITRTYAMLASPGRLEAKLENIVFSDVAPQHRTLSYTIVESGHAEGDTEWKRAYVEGVRSWEEPPPQPGDTTVLCKKHTVQAGYAPAMPLKPLLSFAEKVERRTQRNAREKARMQRKLQALQGELVDGSDSSSSSDASSSRCC